MGAKATFNHITRIIKLTETPTLEDGEYVVRVDVQRDFYGDQKEDWLAYPDTLRKVRPPFYVQGGQATPTGALGDTYFKRSDWKIEPYDADHRLIVTGNLFSVDGKSPYIKPTGGTYAVFLESTVSNLVDSTVSEIPEIQYASFNGGVWIDSVDGTAGTEYPIGTPIQPAKYLSDVLTILEKGFSTVYALGDLIIDSGADYTALIFIGESPTKTLFTVSSNAVVPRCEFFYATVTGTLDGNAALNNCTVGDLTYIYGEIRECMLTAGEIALGGGSDAVIVDCWTDCVEEEMTNIPTVNMGGAGQSLVIRNLNGRVKITNKTGTDDICSVTLSGGCVALDMTTITEGSLMFSGVGTLRDSITKDYIHSGTYGNVTIVNELLNTTGITKKVWDEILTGATYNIPTSAGRRVRAFTNMVVFDSDVLSSTINSITLGSDASSDDGAYDPAVIGIAEGLGAGQSRLILEYEGLSRTATLDRNWKTLPDDTSKFIIVANPGREHVNEGRARGGGVDTIILNPLASSEDDVYVGQTVFLRSGTGEDQACKIMGYDGATRTITSCKPWHTVPDDTTGYVILPAGYLDVEQLSEYLWGYNRDA